jgi:hypothetical protein
VIACVELWDLYLLSLFTTLLCTAYSHTGLKYSRLTVIKYVFTLELRKERDDAFRKGTWYTTIIHLIDTLTKISTSSYYCNNHFNNVSCVSWRTSSVIVQSCPSGPSSRPFRKPCDVSQSGRYCLSKLGWLRPEVYPSSGQ